MAPHEITPEEALSIAEDPETLSAMVGMTAMSMSDNPGVFAGLLLVFQEAVTGTCECNPCATLRNLSAAADQQFNRLIGGLPA